MTGGLFETEAPGELRNAEAELEVMATLAFRGRDAWLRIASLLPDAHRVFAPARQPMARVLIHLAKAGAPIDGGAFREAALALGERTLAEDHLALMSELLDYSLGTGANLEYHAGVVADLAARRELIAAGHALAARAENRAIAVPELVRESVSAIVSRGSGRIAPAERNDGLWDAMQDIEKDSKLNGALPGISSGIPRLDWLLDGWLPRRLIVVAARPGGGKTALGMFCAHVAADADVETLVINLEPTLIELRRRQISLVTGLDLRRLRTEAAYREHAPMLTDALTKLRQLPLTFDGESDSVNAISFAVQQHSLNVAPVQLVIIDYLDYLEMDSDRGRHDLDLGVLCRALRKVAKTLNVAMIVLAQMRRGAEGDRKPKPPVMSDLANSAEIERAADQIIMMWEPPQDDGLAPSELAKVELIIAKNRHGPKGKVDLNWYQSVNRFEQADKWYERGAA